ncbi:general substrate transporter [Kockovaella imperatae]|uniref:General substrate transporter n=1 Tax=Kockovaella imperatae TaxID=4999 RepID=A0A1Y1UJ52_9TREE|nr:general substrate transporter [Kockovaella imperatae]ORX38012.1 general substrate transporter [Kockovaella imperatae]
MPQFSKHLTPYLLFCAIVFSQGAILFGLDTGSFGSLQALPSFLARFGVPAAKGKHVLPATRKSLMNSLPWIGKISGCFLSEPIIERLGFKRTMYTVATIQCVALIIEMSAHVWSQFTIGRILAYLAVGIVENATPSYNSEIAPAEMRGIIGGSIIVFSSLGNLWGAGMSRAYATGLEDKNWMIPTAMQFIPAVLLASLVPFTVESPRWLISKGRREEAQRNLDKLRRPGEVQDGSTAAELDIIENLVQESRTNKEGSWLDLFRGNYLRRTWIAASLFIFEQTNGNQFTQSYSATFYVQEGLGSMSFTYSTLGQVVGLIGAAGGIFIMDLLGRRTAFIGGSAVTAMFLLLAAGLGLKEHKSQSTANFIIASFIIVPATTRISASNCAFLTGAEIGGLKMRKKIMAFGTACDVLAAFLVTFVTPYILPALGVNIGWIFGGVAILCVPWGYLFFPELKGRSLEEVDELFEANLRAWQFSKYQTTGEASTLRALENQDHSPDTSKRPETAEYLEDSGSVKV